MAGMMEKEQIEAEIRGLDQLMRSHDYIGIKIAMGRATKEEYAAEIAKSEEWAQRKSELQALLGRNSEAAETEATEEETEELDAEAKEQTEGENSEVQPEESNEEEEE